VADPTEAGVPRRRCSDRLDTASKVQAESGTLIIIGGNEDKAGDRLILSEVAARASSHCMVVATVASSIPEENWHIYRDVFCTMGVARVEHLDIPTRCAAFRPESNKTLEGAGAVFFTGGDQGQIMNRIAGTPVHDTIRKLYQDGACIAGTSAGAAAMSEVVITSNGVGDEHSDLRAFTMIPGLGLLRGVLIDQHFAQRGRMMRLLAAVAQNPALFGIGIDEDTAIVVEGAVMSVIGAGSVYLVDGHGMTASNATERENGSLSVYDMRVHVLNATDRFDLVTRRPGACNREGG
jgi:cyanophycinase